MDIIDFMEEIENPDDEPECDIGIWIWICDKCRRKIKFENAIPVLEGDWEHGYFTSYDCPYCGGGLGPSMTKKRAE